jgi:hypothetical protein
MRASSPCAIPPEPSTSKSLTLSHCSLAREQSSLPRQRLSSPPAPIPYPTPSFFLMPAVSANSQSLQAIASLTRPPQPLDKSPKALHSLNRRELTPKPMAQPLPLMFKMALTMEVFLSNLATARHPQKAKLALPLVPALLLSQLP